MMTNKMDDFSYLKVGDPVFVFVSSHYKDKLVLAHVTSITPSGKIKTDFAACEMFQQSGCEYRTRKVRNLYRNTFFDLRHYNETTKRDYERQSACEKAFGCIENINTHKNNLLKIHDDVLFDEMIALLEKVSVVLSELQE